jgi:hypothetical protein
MRVCLGWFVGLVQAACGIQMTLCTGDREGGRERERERGRERASETGRERAREGGRECVCEREAVIGGGCHRRRAICPPFSSLLR